MTMRRQIVVWWFEQRKAKIKDKTVTQTSGQEVLVGDTLPSLRRRGRHSSSHQKAREEKCFQLPVRTVPPSQGRVVKLLGHYKPLAVTQAGVCCFLNSSLSAVLLRLLHILLTTYC